MNPTATGSHPSHSHITRVHVVILHVLVLGYLFNTFIHSFIHILRRCPPTHPLPACVFSPWCLLSYRVLTWTLLVRADYYHIATHCNALMNSGGRCDYGTQSSIQPLPATAVVTAIGNRWRWSLTQDYASTNLLPRARIVRAAAWLKWSSTTGGVQGNI